MRKGRIKGHTKSCASKVKYETIDLARAHSKTGKYDQMAAYQCKKCKGYHVGHTKNYSTKF